jgi:hypothetical protein
MSKEDFVKSKLELVGMYNKYIEVATVTDIVRYATISIDEIQNLISKLYLKYNDAEAKEFLENLEI